MGLSIILQLPLILTSSFPPFARANLFANPHLRSAQIFLNFPTGGAENICESRDLLSLVSALPIHKSKGRAFSCTVVLELSNPPFSNAGLRKFFSPVGKPPSCSFCVKNYFYSSRKSFVVFSISGRRGRRHRVTPGPRLSVKVTS